MSVTVQYRTEQRYCRCCDQKLPEPKISDVQEFEVTKENALSWSDRWSNVTAYPEEVEEMVRDFVFDTISFWAVDSGKLTIIEDSEIEKVREMILREFPPAPEEDEEEDA